MKKVICAFSFIMMSISGYSQLMDLPGEYIRQKVVGKNSLPTNVQGSPFYNEAFSEGIINTNDNKSFKAYLRYDAFNDEMQMKQNEEIIALLKFEKDEVEIDKVVYEVYSYFNEGSNENGYFINLTNGGNTRLLLHKGKKYIEGTKAVNTYTKDKPPMFKDDISYYLMKDNSLNVVSLSKKNFLKLLEDKKSELENYISDNKLKLRDEKDFIQLINFYNSL